MKKLKSLRKRKKKISEEDLTIQFRERRLKDIPLAGLKHPKPVPGFKPTLPNPPGGWAKMSPGV